MEKEIVEAKEVAENLNDYFIESNLELNSKIKNMPPPTIKKRIKKCPNEKFKFKKIKYTDIERVLKEIKSNSDPEMINKNIIIDAMPIIGNKLVKIINESFEKGEFPETWKQSTIKPIYKTKNSKNIKNIRPINMLPTYEKIIEKLADEQLQKYVDKNNIINENQSGYRKAHSCETAINMVIQKWKEAIDDNKKIVCVFLDFSRHSKH
jgi:Reverse transcriptase (RNA-dependent DNA polymerase)